MTVELSYDLVPGSGTPGETVVLVGSLGSDRSMWDRQLAGLAEVVDVVAVDLRGHGQSPVPAGPYSIDELSEDVLAVIDSLDRDRVHLVGLSLGGAIVQWIAVHRPARVLSLTLLCTSARFGDPQGWLDRAAAVRADGTESIAQAVLSRWFTPELAAGDADLTAHHRAMISNTPDEGYAAACEALAAWDNRADLGRISARTLVVAGEQDPATTPADLRIIADGVARSTFHVVPNAAHLANVEQAETVTSLIVRHITDDAYRSNAAEHT